MILYFGYYSSASSLVTIPVSENNFFQGPPEPTVTPITSFLPGYHGMAQQINFGSDVCPTNDCSIAWSLGGTLFASVNTANASQQCFEAFTMVITLQAPGATNPNNEQIVSVLSSSTGLSEQYFASVSTDPTAVQVSISSGGSVSPYEAALVINTQFVDANSPFFNLQLSNAVGANVTNIVGASTPQDQPGAPGTPAPLAVVPTGTPNDPTNPVIIPIAHCWEPTPNETNGNSFFYFGYMSTHALVQTIDPNTDANTFLGAPFGDVPVPVFYPGINGFVVRVRAPDSSLIQWNLAGYGVLLDGGDVSFACNSDNTPHLSSAAAWDSGTVSDEQSIDATLALSTVSRLPEANVASVWTNITSGGGFRAGFLLTPGNDETVFSSMWRTVNSFHLADGEINQLWQGTFGVTANNYSTAGTANDIYGQPLPAINNVHIPVAHCWSPGGDSSSKYLYFGYLSNFERTLSFLPSANNWVSNVDGYSVPTVFYPGYNGFATSVLVRDLSSDATTAWNLGGFYAALNFNNQTRQCDPTRTVSLTITYTGVLLGSFDRYAAQTATEKIVKQNLPPNIMVQVQFDATVDGFIGTVRISTDALLPGAQYQAMTQFLQNCNSLNNFQLRNSLSSAAGNANVRFCQGNGLSQDTWGVAGSTTETVNRGAAKLTLTADCWNPSSDNGITAYFGYKLDSDLYYTIPNSYTGAPGSPVLNAQVPQTFVPGTNSYAARITSDTATSITWTVGGKSITISMTSNMCSGNKDAYVSLSFEKLLNSPPDMTPIINYISDLTGYPNDHITGAWNIVNQQNYVLFVTFVNMAAPAAQQLRDAMESWDTMSAATLLIRQVTDNATVSEGISNAAGLHLYAATSSAAPPTPISPTPIKPSPSSSAPKAPTPANKKKGMDPLIVFGIIVGVLVFVGILGAILFFFFKYQKGMCREQAETRPLLAD